MPVADSETIEVEYESALALMRDLGAMGESNLVVERRRGLARRATLLRAAEIYGERFALPSGRVAASFEVLFLHGWAPHASQPKPLKPGSAAHRLADGPGHRRAQRRRKGGAELDRACREIVVRRVLTESFGFFFARLRLFFHLVTIPWILSLVIRIVGSDARPARSLVAVLAEKALDVIPTVMFMVAWQRSCCWDRARRAPAGPRLVAARDGLSRPPDQGGRHHLRAGARPSCSPSGTLDPGTIGVGAPLDPDLARRQTMAAPLASASWCRCCWRSA